VARLRSAWGELTRSAELLIAVDEDDPQLPAYAEDGEVTVCPPLGLGGVINWLAQRVAPLCNHIGFLGDDHCPRTPGWDRMLTEALDGRLGVAYGNDLLLGELVPTAALVSSELITGLGYMVPPGVEHLCHDMFWKELGQATTLAYCPDVIIEHVHPTAGKAPWDEGYARGNSPERYEQDGAAYNTFLTRKWPSDRDALLGALT
jgi:hypothetical protein